MPQLILTMKSMVLRLLSTFTWNFSTLFVSGVTNAITAGGGATGSFTATAGTYDPFSGLMVLTIGTHSLTTSNTVTIADDGVVFTCAQDNNTSNKAYPRSTDPASGSALAITATTSTTITVSVCSSC